MAIVRSQDGTFYEIDDSVLEGREVQASDLPEDARPRPADPGPGGPPPAAGVIQIFVDTNDAAPPPDTPQAGANTDVKGHNRCSWRNCGWQNWRNWRNSY